MFLSQRLGIAFRCVSTRICADVLDKTEDHGAWQDWTCHAVALIRCRRWCRLFGGAHDHLGPVAPGRNGFQVNLP